MKPLLFIIVVTGSSIQISRYFSTDVTWFTHYIGGMAGIIVSAIFIGFWNKRRRKAEEEMAKFGPK